jgi:dolichol-phosphate mannosyltransferase
VRRFLKFVLVGGSGALINLAVFAALILAGLHYMPAAIASFVLAATSNYVLDSLWVFGDRGHGHSKKLYAKFMLVSVFSLGVNLAVLWAVESFAVPWLLEIGFFRRIFEVTAGFLNVSTLSKVTELYSQAAGIAAGTLFNFAGNDMVTFRKRGS